MLFTVSLSLPRDARFVSVLRSVAACILHDIGAPRDAVDDIELALTEACGNAVRHAVGSEEYTVGLTIDADGCEIEVVDLGPGFEPPAIDDEPDTETDHGRGVLLMSALVDDLRFTREASAMSVVLRKSWSQAHGGLPDAAPEAHLEA